MACEECKLHYLAGLLDGEGSFTIVKALTHKERFSGGCIIYRPLIALAVNKLEVIRIINKEFGGLFSFQPYDYKDKIKVMYKIEWAGDDAKNIAKLVANKLLIKRSQAELLAIFPCNIKGATIRFSEEERKLRENIFQKVKELNH